MSLNMIQKRPTPNGRYSGVEPETTGGPSAVDRALKKTTDEASSKKGYDVDARAIAKVMVRHYGDEAEAVLERVVLFLDEARRGKR